MTLSGMPLPTEKMVLILMLLLGLFGGRIGSVCSLTLGCLILLHAPILISHCQGATRYMNGRKDEHMMKEFRRERACFYPLVFAATGPSATTVFRKLASMLADKWSINYNL